MRIEFWRTLGLAMCAAALALGGCGKQELQIRIVPVSERLEQDEIASDSGYFVTDKIAIINLNGLLANTNSGGIFSDGHNKVSDFREVLDDIAADDSVKAVVLRMNTPGGTVSASDMMYRDLNAFRAATHKPVVCAMMDVCASGGFYVSCATDYRVAYPTTITGSIGVIIQTLNFSGTLGKLGISAEAITSGPNKDVGNPFRPMTDNDRAELRHFVDEFYTQFVGLVKDSHPNVKPADWPILTDGRVVSGTEAAKYGLVDEVGDLDDAIAAAKRLAHLKRVKVVKYSRGDEDTGSIYAKNKTPQPQETQLNLVNIDANMPEILTQLHPQFLYLWEGQ